MDPVFVPEPAALFQEGRMTAQNARQYFLVLLLPRLLSLRSRSLASASFPVA